MKKSSEQVFVAKSKEETIKLGKNLAKGIKSGTIALFGDLGSGKTTFVQGLAKGLGLEERIISPTFVIVRKYNLKTQNLKRFYHIDLYRLEEKKEIDELGLSEILNDTNAVVVIEWAERLTNLLPNKRIDIRFKHLNNNQRQIIIDRLL